MPLQEAKKLWVVTLEGPATFVFHSEGNPSVEHNGGTSAHHIYTSEAGISYLSMRAGSFGLRVKARGLQEEKSKIESLPLPEDVQVLCLECPTCPWWDPVTLGQGKSCSFLEASKEYAQTLMENSLKHREAAAACPIQLG